MSQTKEDRDGTRRLHRSRSSVGPGTIAQCLEAGIAKCECDVLQPQPGCEQLVPSFYSTGMVKPTKIVADLHRSQTLLPPSVTRTLCLWKDEEDDEYHLTAIRVDRDEVFLDLPLSRLLTGKIIYDQTHPLWHVVTICEDQTAQQRKLVFNLKASLSNPGEVEEFNKKLSGVIEIIKSPPPHTQEKGEGETSGQAYCGGTENPAVRDVAQKGLVAQEALARSMSSIAPATMATSKPQGPLLGAEAPSLAAGDFPSGLSGNRPYAPLPGTTAKQMSAALAAAIQAGNVKKAQELASVLAQSHTRVEVNFDSATQEKKAREQEIGVTVHVEDRESAGLTLNEVKVRPSDTILDLKRTFLGKYGFPLEVQKWIIGNRICSDDETLSKCEVNCSGHTLFLYLLNARAVNISREDYKRQWQSHSSPGAAPIPGNSMRPVAGADYETMNFPIAGPMITSSSQDFPPTPPQGQGQGQPGGTTRQQSRLSTASSSGSLAPASFSLTDLRGNLDPGGAEPSTGQGGTLVAATAGAVGQSVLASSGGRGVEGRQRVHNPPEVASFQDQDQGWQCESCTLINQPTRPGCEACGNPRPASYHVPPDYVVSDEELQRLQREQQLEAIMQQTSGQAWSHGWGQGGATTDPLLTPNPNTSATAEKLTPEQLDLILRFNDAIQQHIGTPGDARNADPGVDPRDVIRRGANSQLAPSGVRQLARIAREPVQNLELGEDVVDDNTVNTLQGWVSEEDHSFN